MKKVLLFIGLFLCSTSVMAQTSEQNWQKDEPKYTQMLPDIKNAIGDAAAKNIIDAEQIFCYQIAPRPQEYDGYTISGMALVGFCGVINKDLKQMLTTELFMTPYNVDFENSEDCIIRPKIMLRFVRGVDSTDVLMSSPCYSFTTFYAGKIKTFNAKPSAQIIDAFIEPLLKGRIDFASPALFNQLLPIGVAQTPEQKDLLNKKNEPIRKWQVEEESKPSKNKSGWNNLNLNM